MKTFSSFLYFLSLTMATVRVSGCPFLNGDVPEDEADESGCPGRKLQRGRGGRGGRFGGRFGGGRDGGEGEEGGNAAGGGNVECNFAGGTNHQAVEAARSDVRDLIMANPRNGPRFVRLAFHDCVGEFGCNGSINMDNPDNRGLQAPINALSNLVSCYADHGLTRGDIWALAAVEAAEFSQPNGSGVLFPFDFIGRPSFGQTGATEGGNEQMPGPHLTTNEVTSFFSNEFGFDLEQTTAILGAHTLGFLNPQNSGFNGRWVPDPFELDNDFYQVLLDNNNREPDEDFVLQMQGNNYIWRRGGGGAQNRRNLRNLQRGGGGDRGGGGRGGGGRGAGGGGGGGADGGGGGGGGLRMLNADMALVSDFANYIDLAEGGFVSCIPNVGPGDTLDQCPTAPTIGFVQNYANNENLWLNDFRDVLTIMVNKSPTNLTPV